MESCHAPVGSKEMEVDRRLFQHPESPDVQKRLNRFFRLEMPGLRAALKILLALRFLK
jgi:hypothetical protein